MSVGLAIGCVEDVGSDYAYTGEEFALRAHATSGELVVTVTPIAPWKMNLDYPYASRAQLPNGEASGTAREKRSDAFVFEHAIATPPGTRLPVETRFAVCIDALCTPIEHSFEIATD
jgi:hypothetical protein